VHSWRRNAPILRSSHTENLLQTIHSLRQEQRVYPPDPDVFRALELTPFELVSVVILGQDPYHREGQAHGLAFSVPEGVKVPPSLRNIFKEIAADVYADAPPPFSSDLSRWARQGVLLLNAALTVEANRAGSHQTLGWHKVTDALIEALSEKLSHIVFMLWGAHAQTKSTLIDPKRHCLLQSVHPSPLSAYRGFFGCRHFSRANAYLQANGRDPIDW